ncbi:type VII secretion protein EccE [Kribbella sp. CA-293567]|uniref:type VII secretion protein EccE n=1 Tax=Kribbella sp. CA-293567 TaxID=3002436 RepID=UPI0022DDD319|nr:type VII secretion protein EccE [Kribbella sp. CA-293567]WBQ08419.1 type VII secretion protein EccE [Kribbella sp. CA-293567]
MRPSAAAEPVAGQEVAYAPAPAAVPTATSIGTPVARGAVRAQRSTPPATAAVVAAAQPSYLVDPPPAPEPATDEVESPEHTIRIGQIVCWQVALVAIGAATTASRLVLILTALAAVSLLLLTAVRIRGLWLYRWAGILVGYLVRRRQVDLADDPAMNLISLFCGRTSATELTVREQEYGMLSRPAGASVALRVGADAHHQLLPGLRSLADCADEQPIGVSVQLVVHTGTKQHQFTRAWIAVAACRTPDIATDEQVAQVLANTVRRLVRRFDREQVASMPLDESDLLASIGALAHANAGRGLIRERWSAWAAGPVVQVCIRLNGFASLPRPTAQALVDTLLGTGTGSAQTLAITVTAPAGDHKPALHDAVLRVAAAHAATLDTTVTVLTTLARSFGVEPERLDGRHTAGVAATLPLGVPFS